MFRVTVDRPDELTRVLELARDSFVIGRFAPLGVTLPDPSIEVVHARVDTLDGEMFVRAHAPVRVNGTAITVRPLRDSDVIAVGPYVIGVELVDDDTERRLLAAIDAGDHASRLIYADWLEERNEPVRAEYVRLQEVLIEADAADGAFVERAERLRHIASRVPTEWRLRLARTPIERCAVAFEIPCPRDWGSLAPTGRDAERHCGACNKTVRYCTTVEEACGVAA